MEGTGSSSSRLKKKAALGNSLMDVDRKESTTELTDPRIESLVVSNNALKHALEIAQNTINQQDKLMSNLQLKLVSHLPKLIELRLDAMGKVIQQLHSMFDETKALLNNRLSNSCPTAPSSNINLVNEEASDQEINIVDDFIAELETPLPLVQKSSEKVSLSSMKTPSSSMKTPSTSTKTPSNSRKNSSSSVKTTANSKSSSRTKPIVNQITVVPDTNSGKSLKIELKKESPEKMEDELMSLPASTSKTIPKISRKRTSTPKAARKEIPPKRVKSERCKKVKKSQKTHSSSDEDDDEKPLESKSQRLKIKLRPFMKIIENKRSKIGGYSNSTNKDKKNASKAVHDISSSSSESEDDNETSKNSSVPSSTKKSETVLASSNISEDSDSTQLVSKSSTSNNKSKSNVPKPKKKESSRKSKTKSLNEKVKNADATSANKPKVNGTTVSGKARKSNKNHLSLVNNVVNGTMVNGDLKAVAKSATSKSFKGSTETISIAQIKDHQPQVILMDIFSNTDGKVNPLLAKKKEEMRISSKLGRRVEDSPAIEKSKSSLPSSDISSVLEGAEEAPSLDLEVDSIFKEDTVISSNNTKDASPTPNQIDINSMLGLSSNTGVSPGFGYFQNAKDKDSSSDKSFDNEINLDTIDRLLANCI